VKQRSQSTQHQERQNSGSSLRSPAPTRQLAGRPGVALALQRIIGNDHTSRLMGGSAQLPRSSVVPTGGGQPLDPQQVTLATRLGIAPDTVRLHTGATAAAMTAQLGAQAYAVGRDVVLGPDTDNRVLAHELAHVAQTGARPAGAQVPQGMPGDSWETSANHAATAALHGQPAALAAGAPVAVRLTPLRLIKKAPQFREAIQRFLREGGEQARAVVPRLRQVNWHDLSSKRAAFLELSRHFRSNDALYLKFVKLYVSIVGTEEFRKIVSGDSDSAAQARSTRGDTPSQLDKQRMQRQRQLYAGLGSGRFSRQRSVGVAVTPLLAPGHPFAKRLDEFLRSEFFQTLGGALAGEWNDNPTIAMIGIDFAISLIPVLDQIADVRDLTALVYRLTVKNEYNKPMTWVSLAFTLIGIIPTYGTVIKSASKAVIRAIRKGSANIATSLERSSKFIRRHWKTIKRKCWRHWKTIKVKVWGYWQLISQALAALRDRASAKLKTSIEKVINVGAKQLEQALEQIRRIFDEWDRMFNAGARAPRNSYPDFEPVRAGLRSVATQQANRLSAQLGIFVSPDRVLNAPWIGRVRNRAGKNLSVSTSQGWLRNETRFWSQFARQFPDDYKLIGKARKVTPALARRYRWPAELIGDKLVHHHMENSSLVVAIPESLHRRLSGKIHARATVIGKP
jgi:hypothetical protein